MPRKLGLTIILFNLVAYAAAATVDFEQIAKTGDAVPGREGTGTVFKGRAFQTYNPGVFSRPAINESGDVVFRGVSSSFWDFNIDRATGLYLKRPGLPLSVIVDTTDDSSGNPKFVVPGQPAGTRFGDFKAPLINDAGDILFHANYSGPGGSGQGFYATTVDGDPIVRLVDTSTGVPGWPGTLFNQGFTFSGTWQSWVNASLNDIGQVVFIAMFQVSGRPYVDTGMFGTTVSGGTIVRLADSTGSVPAGGETTNFLTISQSNQPAINNQGIVLFQAGIGTNPAYPQFGIFSIPVDGSALSTTVARQGRQSPLMSDGVSRYYFSLFGGHDLNDNGDFIFQHAFQSGTPAIQGLFGGNLNAGTINTIVDNLAGGFEVPGTPGATFFTLTMTTINQYGHMGFYADNTISNGQGIYSTNLVGSPLSLIANNSMVPPGQTAPAVFQNFNFQCAEVNESGNMVLAPGARNASNTDALFGLYFYDNCTRTLERLVDTDTATPALPEGLGDFFLGSGCAGSPCERGIFIHQGGETRAGHYRAINNSNEIAFMTAFETFTVGIYVARVTSGSGPLSITCPPNASVECPGNTSPDAVGEPTISGCGSILVEFEDEVASGCGGTQTITRTWTADNGSGIPATCTQVIELVDTTPPEMTVPGPIAIPCGADLSPSATGEATAQDACDPAPVISYIDETTPGDCDGNFTITRVWTATDACGNAYSAGQTISVTDNLPPAVSAPADITLACGDDSSPTSTGFAVATDDCDSNPLVTWSDATATGSCDSEVVITRTWTAADACGNVAETEQIITLIDDEAPVLTLDTTPIFVADSNCNGVETVALPVATATDNCPGPVTIANDAPASFPAGETTTVTFTATDGCGNSSSQTVDVTVSYGAAIRVTAKKYTIGPGNRPWVVCEPLDNIPISAFELNCGSCALHIYLQYWLSMTHALPRIFQYCEPITTGVTNSNGVVLLDVPPGNYLVASHFDDNGDGIPETYLGVLTLNVRCGQTRLEYLYMIQVVNNRKHGCNWHYFSGSELIVIEPQEVLWDDTEQLYPFVFDSEGDWEVDVSVTPPEGFVSDFDALSDTVNSDLKALQFTITEVGSDLVPTVSHFEIRHKGRVHVFDSAIDIKLTPDYARSRGFNVDDLRQRGLIVDKQLETSARPQQKSPITDTPTPAKPRK